MGVQELWSANSPGTRARSRPVDKESTNVESVSASRSSPDQDLSQYPLFQTYISQSGSSIHDIELRTQTFRAKDVELLGFPEMAIIDQHPLTDPQRSIACLRAGY